MRKLKQKHIRDFNAIMFIAFHLKNMSFLKENIEDIKTTKVLNIDEFKDIGVAYIMKNSFQIDRQTKERMLEELELLCYKN